jgi:hypothetical protein
MLQERLSRRVRCQLHRTLRAMLSMHGRRELLHTVVHSVCQTGTTGRAAPPLGRSWWAAAPSLTSLVPPRRMTLQVHSPRMTRSRLHLLRLVLTVLQMHLRTRRTTYTDGLGPGGGGGPREREVRNRRGRYFSFSGLFIFKLFLYDTIFLLIG